MELKPKKLFYRVSTVSQMIDVCKSTTYNLIDQGEIEAVRIGKSIRVSAEALDKFVNRKKAEGLGA